MILKEVTIISSSIGSHTAALLDGSYVSVKAMTPLQVHETYRLVQEAAQEGQGFGADEYADEKEFRDDIEDGYQFAVTEKDSGTMVAAFILAVSKYSRGCQVADPFIVVRKDQRGRGLGTFCMDMCVQYAGRLGFMGIYCDTFSNNKAMIKIVESIPGFIKVGCLPMGGKLKDGTLVGTEIYYKDLRPTVSDSSG